MARRGLRESVVQLGRVPADRRVEPVLVLRREDPTEGGERGALQRSGKVVASAVECPGDCNRFLKQLAIVTLKNVKSKKDSHTYGTYLSKCWFQSSKCSP